MYMSQANYVMSSSLLMEESENKNSMYVCLVLMSQCVAGRKKTSLQIYVMWKRWATGMEPHLLHSENLILSWVEDGGWR